MFDWDEEMVLHLWHTFFMFVCGAVAISIAIAIAIAIPNDMRQLCACRFVKTKNFIEIYSSKRNYNHKIPVVIWILL